MSPEFDNYFKLLAGSWSLKRSVSTGETLIGKAVFEHVSSTAFLLREVGDLTLLNGAIVPATRNWFWHLLNNSVLEITYDEERSRDYHLIDLCKKDVCFAGIAEHLCGADVYSGDYIFCENSFEIIQTVKGSNKDYCITSVYSK